VLDKSEGFERWPRSVLRACRFFSIRFTIESVLLGNRFLVFLTVKLHVAGM
jgi:hypothetical protein